MVTRVVIGKPVSRSVIVASDNTTIISRVVIGKPVRRVTSGAFNINNLGGVDTVGVVDGALLIYSSSLEKWTTSIELNGQNINGGSY